ncbi:starch-binding domain protein (macronuclear) [Tetrahymena thermophila SB210]|uniref:Starch-binding domain protein n=1 Tax=Tetrahymena thermophila (strain SB210) TaxID=312017 RepID=Q22H08_TETTS|nr:starch-binding domain protein [Tetrahymena thermophila SB210]EAR84516.3 starch-binding domain protein [Tetrahymena thermophila SB210]|eukprot:XP_001032179.3 starch-binding domain protein [Tetrahymena thermophila SB210]
MDFQTPETQVAFSVRCPTYFGQAVYISGNCDQLGNWNTEKATRMNWSEGNLWWCDISLPTDVEVEYKYYVADYEDMTNEVCWEQISNRVFRSQECQTKEIQDVFNHNFAQGLPETQNQVETERCEQTPYQEPAQQMSHQQLRQDVLDQNFAQNQPQSQNCVETERCEQTPCLVPAQETPNQQLSCKQQSSERLEDQVNGQERSSIMSSSTCNSEKNLSSPEKSELPQRVQHTVQPTQNLCNPGPSVQASQSSQKMSTQNCKMSQKNTTQQQVSQVRSYNK